MRGTALLPVLALLLAAASKPAVPHGRESEHTVRAGETLNGIAIRSGVARKAIIEANGLKPPYAIRIGQKLKIPRKGAPSAETASRPETEHTVRPGETLSGIASRAGVSSTLIAQANGLKPPYPVRVGQKLKIPGKGAPAAESAPASSPEPESEHIVRPGETLSGIASRTGVPSALIAEANGLKRPYPVRVGQKLVIPRERRHTVEKGESAFSIAYTYGVPWEDIAVASGIDPHASIHPGQELVIPTATNLPPATVGASPAATPESTAAAPVGRFMWPVRGSVRRGFRARGRSSHHDGLDIQAPRGTAVLATAAGKVIFAGKKGEFGNLVVISHSHGWYSAYGFLGRITVRKGSRVLRGERIGFVGDTGVAKRDELHFELRHDNVPVDPTSELPKRR